MNFTKYAQCDNLWKICAYESECIYDVPVSSNPTKLCVFDAFDTRYRIIPVQSDIFSVVLHNLTGVFHERSVNRLGNFICITLYVKSEYCIVMYRNGQIAYAYRAHVYALCIDIRARLQTHSTHCLCIGAASSQLYFDLCVIECLQKLASIIFTNRNSYGGNNMANTQQSPRVEPNEKRRKVWIIIKRKEKKQPQQANVAKIPNFQRAADQCVKCVNRPHPISILFFYFRL